MRKFLSYQQILYAFVLLLSAGLALAYPAHLVIEHSGLFHHHDDYSGHAHTDEEDICGVCISLSFTDISENSDFFAVEDESPVVEELLNLYGKESQGIFSARAPPEVQIEKQYYKINLNH